MNCFMVSLLLVLAFVIAVAVSWWRDYNSAEKQIERRKLLASDRKILSKTHEIIDELGENNRFEEDQLVLEREGRDEWDFRRGEYMKIAHWQSIFLRHAGLVVFEARNTQHYTLEDKEEYWSERTEGYIPGSWEQEFDQIFYRAKHKSETRTRRNREEWKQEERNRFGL